MATTAEQTHLEDSADRIRPTAASNLLLWAILSFFALFVVWALVVKLDRTVHATGRIVPSGKLQVIANQEGGTIAAILVHPGDIVQRGQPLVRLAPSALRADLAGNVNTVTALTLKIARLQAEVTGREPVYAAAQDAAASDQIGMERALHAVRVQELATQTAEGDARVAEAQRAVAEAESAHASRIAAWDSARHQLDMVRPLVERGIEPRLSLIQLEAQVATGSSDAAQAAAAMARARASVAEARAAVGRLRQQWRSQAATDLAAAQAEMATKRSATPALAERLRRSTVTSPAAGRVNRVLVSTVGSSIGPNQPIVEVVPSADSLTVEALVSPKDIGTIRVGQHARINISAYESSIYGAMDGQVVTISPDATIDERTGESHYIVRVKTFADTLRDQHGRPLPIGAGMTADVNLLGDKRSVMAYLLTPIARLQERALRE